MLCNKDKAGRAKEIAEMKFAEDDLDGAKQFALVAQGLYSELDGLHQLLATLDVHISFRQRINGVVDWYRILGVEPLADDETIKKHFKKLALTLHPDKNKSIGAEGAFKIISDASNFLSDKSKRIAYDQMWNGIYAELAIQKSSPPVPSGENSFHNFASNSNMNASNSNMNSSNYNMNASISNLNASNYNINSSKNNLKASNNNLKASNNNLNGSNNNLNASNNNLNVINNNLNAGNNDMNASNNDLNTSNNNLNASNNNSNAGNNNLNASNNNSNAGNNDMNASNNNLNASNNNLNASDHNIPPSSRCSASRSRSKPATFWTACSVCKMHFEYHNAYLNQNLLCPSCHQPFLAKETTSPPSNGKKFSTHWSAFVQQHSSGRTTVDESSLSLGKKPASATTARPGESSGVDLLQKKFQTDAFLKLSSTRSAPDPSLLASQLAGEVQPSCGQLNTAREEAGTLFMREVDFQMKTHDSEKGVSGLSTGSSCVASSSVTKGDRVKRRRGKNEDRKKNDGNSSQTTVDENSSSLGKNPASAATTRPAESFGFDLLQKSFQAYAFWKQGSTGSAPDPSLLAAQVAGEVQPSCGQLKRAREEAEMSFIREVGCQMKSHDSKKDVSGLSTGSFSAASGFVVEGNRVKKRRRKDENVMAKRTTTGIRGVSMFGSESNSFETRKVEIAGSSRNVSMEWPQLDIQSVLMEKALKEIGNKLGEWSRNAVVKTSDESTGLGNEIKQRKGNQKVTVHGVKADANKHLDFVDTRTGVANSDVEFGKRDTDPTIMNVPDPDFHDFDQDRTENSFGENQVWAAYDDDDGMPRYYAMIHGVISVKPFKMQISWLNSKSNNELAPLNWVGSGFAKTSGDFWRGKIEVYNTLNSFSHKVRWVKGTRGAIQIYPKKGDVWAIYTNWSDDWNEHTPDEVIHKYDMVEVLEDYSEAKGVNVVQLAKVPGFKTVFRRSLDQRQTIIIPRQEMFRFSHQVPSYLLTGQEGNNAPKDCLELDPASTPLELLQVLTEAQLEEMKTASKAKEKYSLDGVKNPKGEALVEDGKATEENGIAKDICENIEAEGMMKKGNEIEKGNMLVYSRRP